MITIEFTEQFTDDKVTVYLHNGNVSLRQNGPNVVLEIGTIIQELYTLHNLIESLESYKIYKKKMEG